MLCYIDKCVLYNIVIFDLSSANSIIRLCKKFQLWMYENKELMRIIGMRFLTHIECKIQFQMRRIFGPNRHFHCLKIMPSNMLNVNESNIEVWFRQGSMYANDIEDTENTSYIIDMFTPDDLDDMLKQPSLCDANNKLLQLYDQVQNLTKWLNLSSSSYVYLSDLIMSYNYIVNNLKYMKKGVIRKVFDKICHRESINVMTMITAPIITLCCVVVTFQRIQDALK